MVTAFFIKANIVFGFLNTKTDANTGLWQK